MCYQIYKIGYQISDEIKKRKENEKPYGWDLLHPDVKTMTIEQVDEQILKSGISPEKFKELTKHEKYMIISQGFYQTEAAAALQNTPAPTADDSFLDTGDGLGTGSPTPSVAPGGGTDINYPEFKSDDIEPINFGGAGNSNPLENPLNQGTGTTEPPPVPAVGDGITPPPAVGSPVTAGAKPKNAIATRKKAQEIIRTAVNKINTEATDEVPEGDLLDAVLEELNGIKRRQPMG